MSLNWFDKELFLISRRNLHHTAQEGKLQELEVVANSIGYFIACTAVRAGHEFSYVLADCHDQIRYFKSFDTAHAEAQRVGAEVFNVNLKWLQVSKDGGAEIEGVEQ